MAIRFIYLFRPLQPVFFPECRYLSMIHLCSSLSSQVCKCPENQRILAWNIDLRMLLLKLCECTQLVIYKITPQICHFCSCLFIVFKCTKFILFPTISARMPMSPTMCNLSSGAVLYKNTCAQESTDVSFYHPTSSLSVCSCHAFL